MRNIFFSFLLFLVVTSTLVAQPEIIQLRDEGVPLFYYELVNVAADDSSLSRMLVNLVMSYDEFQFLKASDSLFQAEVEIGFMINNSENEQVVGKSFREKITAQDFNQSNSSQALFQFHTSFDLPAAEYTFVCEVTDLDSKKTGRQKQKTVLRNFDSQKLSLSDLQLRNRQDLPPADTQLIAANFAQELADTSDYMAAYFEIYSRNDAREFKINYELPIFATMKSNRENSTMLKPATAPVCLFPCWRKTCLWAAIF